MPSTPPPQRASPASRPPPPRPFFRSHSSSSFYRSSSVTYRSSPSLKMPKVLKPLHKKEKDDKKIEKKEKKMEKKAEKMERKVEKLEKKLEKKRHHHHHHHHHHRRTTTITTAATTATATTTTITATTKKVVKSSGSERKESSNGKTPTTTTTTTTTTSSSSIYPSLPLPSAPSPPPPSIPPFTLPTLPPPPILPPPSLDPDLSDLLCCPICMEEYKPGGEGGGGGDPLFLHCHHSLCRNCLPRLLRTHIGKGGKETVEVTCPECRVVTLVPSGGLTQNFYLVSLIEARRKRPKEPGSRLRMWCEECDTVALDRCASHRLCHLSSVLARLTHTYTRAHTHTTALLQTKVREERGRVRDVREAMEELEKSTSFLHSRLEERLERSSLHATTASTLLTEVQEMEKRVGVLGRRKRGGDVSDSPRTSTSSCSSSSSSSSTSSTSSSSSNSLDLETQKDPEAKDTTEQHTETDPQTTSGDLWKHSPYPGLSSPLSHSNAPQKSTSVPKTREDRHSSGLETVAHLCHTKDTPSARPQRHSTGLESFGNTHGTFSDAHQKLFSGSSGLERCRSGPDWYTDGEQKYSCGLGRSNSSPEKERNVAERKVGAAQKFGHVAEISGSGLERSTTSLGKFEKYLHRTEPQRDATEKSERENLLPGTQNWAKRSELVSVQKFVFGTENSTGTQKLGLDVQNLYMGATGVQILATGAQKTEKPNFATDISASESHIQNFAIENLRYGLGTYATQTPDGQNEPLATQTLDTDPQSTDAQPQDTDGPKHVPQTKYVTGGHETLATQTESDSQTLSSALAGRETTEILGLESAIETHLNSIGSCDIENRIALLKACITSLKDMERKLEGMEGVEERREGGMEVNLDSLLQMFTKAVHVLGE